MLKLLEYIIASPMTALAWLLGLVRLLKCDVRGHDFEECTANTRVGEFDSLVCRRCGRTFFVSSWSCIERTAETEQLVRRRIQRMEESSVYRKHLVVVDVVENDEAVAETSPIKQATSSNSL